MNIYLHNTTTLDMNILPMQIIMACTIIIFEVVLMIKAARLKKHLSQKQLAKKVGITQSYLSRIENGGCVDFKLSIKAIIALSKELDVCPVRIALELYKVCKNCQLPKTECPKLKKQ